MDVIVFDEDYENLNDAKDYADLLKENMHFILL